MKKIFLTKKIIGKEYKTISNTEKKISFKARRSIFQKEKLKKMKK